MTPVLLADDLSGAMEAAAVFLRTGWRPVLPFALPAASWFSNRAAPRSSLYVLSTETRNAPPDSARRGIAALLETLRASGCGLLFKKIDSTMRGPVGAELSAILSAFPSRPVLVTPANPAAGRTVRDGILRVNGARVTTTAFRNDPGSPVLHDEIARLISASGIQKTNTIAALPLAALRSGDTACAAAIRAHIAAGRMLIACDAETDADLDTLVQAAHHAHDEPILTGSGALAAALARGIPQPSAATPGATPQSASRVPHLKTLYACGSMHPLSRRQMMHLGIPVRTLPFDPAAARPVIDMLAADLDTAAHAAAFVLEENQPVTAAQWLEATTRAVAAIHDRTPPGALFVTGGETARSVCQRLGGASLELCGEIEQGVAAAHLDMPGVKKLLVITKPGGFGDDQTLQRVRDWIAGRSGVL